MVAKVIGVGVQSVFSTVVDENDFIFFSQLTMILSNQTQKIDSIFLSVRVEKGFPDDAEKAPQESNRVKNLESIQTEGNFLSNLRNGALYLLPTLYGKKTLSLSQTASKFF